VQFQDVPVGTMESGINAKDRLDVILTGWNVPDAVERKPECLLVDDGGLAGLQPLDIQSEERLRRPPVDGRHPRLVFEVAEKRRMMSVEGSV
jgi:hypothetical protein